MRVIGTAGHVDHGKSTLVQALTGVHPDRLKEEREREMTIDLGFAWMNLPSGEEVGIIDVPGHRDFIENMLAGVGGIDAALFVVAADEGVMPQTREHLAILDLLQIQGGVVALTKIDMIEEPNREDWLDLIEADLREVLQGTVLQDAEIMRVSARTGEGLPQLLEALTTCLAERPPRADLLRPRLPVDRVFTMAGFGTVVTGTLSDGRLQIGDDLEILPAGLRGRVRGLETHKRKEEVAFPGSRVAINISGIAVDQIQRGDVVTRPGTYQPSRRLDVNFRLLPDASQTVKHNTEVKLFIGASEMLARLRLLGTEELLPGETGWLQLETVEPVVVMRGDRYILRRPSPGETIGGGTVVDPHPKKRYKRYSTEAATRLAALMQGAPEDILLQAMLALGAAPLREVMARSNLESEQAGQALAELLRSGQLIVLENSESSPAPDSLAGDSLVTSLSYWQQFADQAVHEVENYHRNYPLRSGLPREELKSRLKTLLKPSPRMFNPGLQKLFRESRLQEAGPLVKLPGHSIQFTPQQKSTADRLLARFAANPYSPPSVKECLAEVGEELYSAMVELDQLVPVGAEVVFRHRDYEKMVTEIQRLINERNHITAAEVRDHFGTSRRYALALLEHLDAIGVTVRDGDARRLK